MSAERHAPRIERAALAPACVALKVFPLPGVVLLPGEARVGDLVMARIVGAQEYDLIAERTDRESDDYATKKPRS